MQNRFVNRTLCERHSRHLRNFMLLTQIAESHNSFQHVEPYDKHSHTLTSGLITVSPTRAFGFIGI